jgi:transcriptional regulator with XRE-family HTH domain
MKYEVDTQKLGAMVKEQRANHTLRELAKHMGDVSASTLSRIEAGKCPDLFVFLRVCSWLNVEPETFITYGSDEQSNEGRPKRSYLVNYLVDLIRSDKSLDPTAINVLVAFVRATYMCYGKPNS